MLASLEFYRTLYSKESYLLYTRDISTIIQSKYTSLPTNALNLRYGIIVKPQRHSLNWYSVHNGAIPSTCRFFSHFLLDINQDACQAIEFLIQERKNSKSFSIFVLSKFTRKLSSGIVG
ncbi:hypothetical protein TNIN_487431 [Trichonephila inaurata madagascariensis]|uniref:Uncharacterized protein n=1 Tax=Trichonephila inaurata madagascariensis TaxID=2747483 RepID=A0A8X7C5Z6_9ARAC|nr:hypothetical protein TNIN_487431 [Trichonephila inaurata madagascariensis]